ncbi:lipocalin-15-like isoform X2 [Struthio camelus]|uniref:lipocalin-15-like isoform X2 n=1 Tax=Struthio camelus TaxID=8801 RepID=UPI003603E6F6
MKTVLSSLALALLCLPWTQAEAPVQPGFDSEKFAGTWHIMAAVSNCPVFLSMKDKMKSSIIVTNFTPEGNLAMKVIFPMSDECKKLELFFQQSGQAGHYIDTAEEKRDLRVMETDYDHYAIVYTVKESDREPSTTLQLYTRGQDVDPQLLKKFKELYPTMGLTDDMLVVMPKSGECQQGRQGDTYPLCARMLSKRASSSGEQSCHVSPGSSATLWQWGGHRAGRGSGHHLWQRGGSMFRPLFSFLTDECTQAVSN